MEETNLTPKRANEEEYTFLRAFKERASSTRGYSIVWQIMIIELALCAATEHAFLAIITIIVAESCWAAWFMEGARQKQRTGERERRIAMIEHALEHEQETALTAPKPGFFARIREILRIRTHITLRENRTHFIAISIFSMMVGVLFIFTIGSWQASAFATLATLLILSIIALAMMGYEVLRPPPETHKALEAELRLNRKRRFHESVAGAVSLASTEDDSLAGGLTQAHEQGSLSQVKDET